MGHSYRIGCGGSYRVLKVGAGRHRFTGAADRDRGTVGLNLG